VILVALSRVYLVTMPTNIIVHDTVQPEKLLPIRQTWGNKIEFLLSCIGLAVGLGNVWRFPYLCYKNGGGAFFIPYIIFLVGGGIPIFFLEVALGQYMGEGGISAWKICPVLTGIGYGTIVVVALLNIYYIVVLAWALVYLGYSCQSELPWTNCNNAWNTENCYVKAVVENSTLDGWNSAAVGMRRVDPAVEFWDLKILQVSDGIEEIGKIRWELALALLGAWIIVYLCVWKGIKSSGKIVYFTATFPYLMLTILLIRGVTLPGALDGIIYYLNPNFARLLDSDVWMDAGTQIFFSYAVALGSTVALGSYNKYHHNCYKDCIILSCINSGTSVYAGFVIFSVLGFMAHELDLPIDEVAESGPGLIFIVYPKALAQMPGAQFWSIAFFFMILLIGLDSQFVQTEGLVTAIVDLYPNVFRWKYAREVFSAAICIVTFFVGLVLVTNGGIYVFQLFDYYSASGITLLWFCFFECVTISWIYGVDRFYDNIADMIGHPINPWLKFCWKYITPLMCAALFIFSVVTHSAVMYNGIYVYPMWATIFGYSLALNSMLCIPIVVVWKLLQAPGTLAEKWKATIKPILTRPEHKQDIPLTHLN